MMLNARRQGKERSASAVGNLSAPFTHPISRKLPGKVASLQNGQDERISQCADVIRDIMDL